MGLRFCGALGRSAIFEKDHRTNKLIAPLDMIDEAELELVKSGQRVHSCVSPRVQPLVCCSHSGARKRAHPAPLLGALRGRMAS